MLIQLELEEHLSLVYFQDGDSNKNPLALYSFFLYSFQQITWDYLAAEQLSNSNNLVPIVDKSHTCLLSKG